MDTDIKLELWIPRHQQRRVSLGELDAAYRTAPPSATFTWNDLGDQVLIVAVDDDHCTVSMLDNNIWYYLAGSDSTDEVEICLAGEPAHVPEAAVLARATGLAVLKQANEFDKMLESYSWIEQ
jgi:hypothetical protein